jgi:hypothetical protein
MYGDRMTMGTGGNPYGVMLHAVKTPSGADINLQSTEEAVYYEQRRDLYLQHNHFVNISDIQDLDRLLTLEIMVFRWSYWLNQGFDYIASRVDEKQLKDSIREFSTEIRQVKSALGIDKVNRDRDKGENFGDYLTNFLARGKEFGYMRNEDYDMAVTLFWELTAMVRTFYRADTQEREELGLSADIICEHIRDKILPRWDALQQSHRKNQAIWVRDPGKAIQQIPTQAALPSAPPIP